MVNNNKTSKLLIQQRPSKDSVYCITEVTKEIFFCKKWHLIGV